MLTVFIRSVLLVCLAVCALRLMGKRQVGQLQPFELVIAIMIADLAATPMESLDTPLWRGVVPMAALAMLHQIFSLLSLKSQKMRRFFSGSPTIIIRDGRIDYQALEKLCFNLNDLLEELRTGGVLSPTEVGTAIMETSGKLSVFPTARKRPVTPEDMKLPTGYEGVPLTLILDGQLERNNLPLLGKDESWLQKQLGELGFSEIRQVLLCYIDTDGVMSVHGFRGEDAFRRGGEVVMRRSVILITVILVLCLSLGIWMDVSQQQVARKYLDSVRLIRELADGGQQAQAYDEQRYLHAKWQHDAVWLNYLISHHHTRAVSAAMVELATALERQWDVETFQALDELEDALRDVEQSDFPYWENIL